MKANKILQKAKSPLFVSIQSQAQKDRVTFTVSASALWAHAYHAIYELWRNDKKFFTIFVPVKLVSIALKNKNLSY